MKTYTFLIGTTDDFESLDELIGYVEANHDEGFQNYSHFEFEAPESCDQETVTMIGRGIAFSNDWAMDERSAVLLKALLTELQSKTCLKLVRQPERSSRSRIGARPSVLTRTSRSTPTTPSTGR